MNLTCAKCGSSKIIPKATTVAHHFPLHVVVITQPDALIFKGTEYAELNARICGDCGYTELFTENASHLYDAYVQSTLNKS